MNPTASTNEGKAVPVDSDIEEDRDTADGNETQIDASGLEVDTVGAAKDKETIAKYQNTSQKPKGSSYDKQEHITENSYGSRKYFIPCAFVVVAGASGATGALIATRRSPSAIASPGATQSTLLPITVRPTTAAPTQSNPTEQPTPGPTPPKTAAPSALALTPRQSNIFDAFAEYGPVHDEAFEWLLYTDEWTPSVMVSDTKHLWYERYAVATFLYSTNVPYLAKSAFRTTNSICQWAGVGCSNELVDTLDFSNSMLSGSLPTEIGILTGLSYFDIANNDVGGSLPSEIGLLYDLDDLILSNNAMTGTLPPELGMIPHPWFLYADNNRFSGSLPSGLEKFLGIDLSSNELSENLPSDLFTDRLTMLILNDNELTGSLPEEVGTASQLTTLWLGNNELSGSIPPLNEILSSCRLQNNAFSDTVNGDICSL